VVTPEVEPSASGQERSSGERLGVNHLLTGSVRKDRKIARRREVYR
jgi:hypothetical protein